MSQERDETISVIELSSNRSALTTGGFLDNWDDEISSDVENNTQGSLFLHWYRFRCFTSQPSIIYSSEVKDIRLASLAGNVDTTFNQVNMANGLIKKWEMTEQGRTWSEIGHTFKKKRSLDDAMWKIQIVNKDPAGMDSMFFGIVEFGITYDATVANVTP